MNGRNDKPTKIDDMTGKYVNFVSAQLHFLQTCGIINYQEFFDFSYLNQITFDDL